MIEKIKKIWNDPVGSKLIAGGIMGLISLIYLTKISLVNDESFIENAKQFLNIKITILNIIFGIFTFLVIWIIIIKVKKRNKKEEFIYNESHKVLDFELYNRIKNQLLPLNGSIAFIRQNNFSGFSFRVDSLNDLHEFEYEFEKPDFEFIDSEMESVFEKIKHHTATFTSLVGDNTWNTRNPNIHTNSVPPEWELEQPERFWDVVNKIHSEAQSICSNYDELIKLGRRKLAE
jgi:hypothetical protein